MLDAGDKQAVPIIQQKCLDAVGEVEQAMVRGFPFDVPQEYADLPQLKVSRGREWGEEVGREGAERRTWCARVWWVVGECV